jgi:hypothetical protein
MKLRDLIEQLTKCLPSERILDNELVVRQQTLGTAIGCVPTIKVTGIHHGFDWDAGQTFIGTEVPIRATSEAFLRQQKMCREMADQLGWIWLIIGNKDLSDKQKISAIRSQINRRRARRNRHDRIIKSPDPLQKR